MCVTTVEGSLKDNSPTQARSILRLLVKPFRSVTVSYFTKQWKQKSEWIPPNSLSLPELFSCFIKWIKGRTVSSIPHKFPFNEGSLIARRMKRLEWYVQILVKRLLKGGKLQHVRRGISIEKQIQKRDATFANTISKFDFGDQFCCWEH